MTKTNVKMEQFIANLMRNFIGVSSSEEFQEIRAGKARVLEDNTLEFLMAEYKDIQIIQSVPFSDFMGYLQQATPDFEKQFEKVSAAFIGELNYGTPVFEFFYDVYSYMFQFLENTFSSISEQEIRETINDKIIEFLTNNPDAKLDGVTSFYEDYSEKSDDLYSEYQALSSDWDNLEYVDMVFDNCSSFINLLLMFKEFDVNVNLNSEFKKNENSFRATRIVTVELELPSGNKLVFKKGEGKLKKALYHNLLQIVSDELSVEKVLKNIKLETGKEDKSAYDDLFKDFTFIQELKQKIEKLLVK
jgi:hypothetical protein